MKASDCLKYCGMILALFTSAGSQAQQKRIYIAPDDHTDYMWSGNEEQYATAFTKMLDYYIGLIDSTQHEPYPYQFKWNCDGSYWVYVYRQNRSQDQFNKLIGLIRDEKITVPMNTLVGLNGVAPFEATLRSMYFAGSLQKKYGLNLELAMNMEDQVMPLGLASLWAGSGAKYSWHGVCNCVTKVKGLDARPNQLYWYKGQDGQRVLMKWYSLTQSLDNRELGGYAEAFDPVKSIKLCKELMQSEKYPYSVAGAFGMGWDSLAMMTGKFLTAARKGSDGDCQVIVSNELDFFRDVEKEYGQVLPSETVSYGTTEWGINLASLAAVSAGFKRSVEKLRTAEALCTYVSLKDPVFCSDLAEKRELAWIACGLYVDHDWTSDGHIITRHERALWQRKIASDLRNYVDTLYSRSLQTMGKYIKRTVRTNEEFFVFNPLGWVRTDYCDYPYEGDGRICVLDESKGQPIPFQIISVDSKQFLRILAMDIPPAGYKVFEIRKGNACPVSVPAIRVTENTMENDFYKITLDNRGALISIVDKANGNHDLVKQSGGMYMNDLGGGNDGGSQAVKLTNPGPVSATFTVTSGVPLRHKTRITLFNKINRIGIENLILENFRNEVNYAFSYSLDKPEIRHEEAGAILVAKPLSEGGHYSEVASRLDLLGLNHFVSFSDSSKGIVLSNRDAYFMKTGNSKTDSLDFTTPRVSILAGGQIDADINLGIPEQDGDSYFENSFALRSFRGRLNATQSMKFALEHQNPLVSGKVSGITGYPAKTYSLLNFSDPGVVVWTLKPAEEGIKEGIIARIWNLESANRKCTISSPLKIRAAKNVTHIEKDLEALQTINGKVVTELGHNRIHSFRIFLGE